MTVRVGYPNPSTPAPAPTPVPNVYLQFQGVGFSSKAKRSFQAMVGADPPTISGGYAKWQTVDRLLQRGLTIFQGYDPVTMTVSIRFGTWLAYGSWNNSDAAGKALEADISALDWMAGGLFAAGPSPAVYMWCYSNTGGQTSQTDLIPQKYQYPMPWIITGLQWGQAYRNSNGYRIWQDATVTLMGYLNLSQAPTPDATTVGSYFVTRAGRDTALLIAGYVNDPTTKVQDLARAILSTGKNNPCKQTSISLGGRSISWKIRDGVSVWVPAHTVV